MNKDTIAGAIKETGGKVRKNIDRAFGDKKGAARGAADEIAGNTQKNYGKLSDE